MSRSLLLITALLLLAAACTRAPDTQLVQVPTLASLPTQQSTTEPPSPSPSVTVPSATPTTVFTSTTVPLTPTIAVTLAPSGLPTMTQRPSDDLSGWIVLTQVSPFDDSVLMGVVRDADSPIQAWLSTPTPSLFFRCNKGSFDIFMQIGAELDNPPDLTDQVHVKLRYDQGAAQDAVMNTMGTNDDAAGFINAQQTLRDMLTHKKLAFGFTPYNAPFTYTTFTLDGLEIALQPVLKACNIPDPAT